MADRITKLQRWLDLVAYLAGRRFPAALDEVWGAVPAYAPGLDGGHKERVAARRMFERDKKELRELGIPIETVAFSINSGTEESHGYRLARSDFHLPYLRLVQEAGLGEGTPAGVRSSSGPREFSVSPDEARAALEGLREVASLPGFALARDARSAFRKLSFDLDPTLLEQRPAVLYVEDAEVAATADLLRQLASALMGRKAATFRYHSMGRDEEADRSVLPYGLLFQHGRWYLVAHAKDRDAVRMFRVGRMRKLSVNHSKPGTPDYEIPAGFELRDFAGRRAWELGDEGPEAAVKAHVLFRFPRSLWAERNGHGTLLREEPDGSQLREMAVYREDPFLRWVLSLAGDARVEAPEPLAHAFRSMVAAVAHHYGFDVKGAQGD